MQGAKPTHPELLDWLATEFVRQKWSQKAHSAAHCHVGRPIASPPKDRQDVQKADPYNKLLAHQNRLRLEAETIRDEGLERLAGC